MGSNLDFNNNFSKDFIRAKCEEPVVGWSVTSLVSTVHRRQTRWRGPGLVG